MARKNPFANLLDDEEHDEVRPAFGYAVKGASRSILNSINDLAAQADKLVEGETVIELDPGSVDSSFVQDRLSDHDEREFYDLVAAIRERGQDTPILVRPHPSAPARYMVVFGHRRLRAAKELGRKVRAVVKDLEDRDHVVAQGQENSARANLSFIEKALYASNVASLRYDDDNSIVLAALSIDRATLSKMLSVAGLSATILRPIGPAKGIGRDRWYELKLLLDKPSTHDLAVQVVNEDGFEALASDERFNTLVSRLKGAKPVKRGRSQIQKRNWVPPDGLLAAEIRSEGKRFTLALKAKNSDATAFGDYLSSNLDRLYEEFQQEVKITNNGD